MQFAQKRSASVNAETAAEHSDSPDGLSNHAEFSCDNHSLLDSNWDKQSCKSTDAMSEISMDFLRDRISHMEEVNFSTYEELQATLQELADLQNKINELNDENETLASERQVLLESLCHETEKLEKSRRQVENLKSILLSDKSAVKTEHEKLLLELLDLAKDEKEELGLCQAKLLKLVESTEAENNELRDSIRKLSNDNADLRNQTETEEINRLKRDRALIDLEERINSYKKEVQRYRELYESEKRDVEKLRSLKNDSSSDSYSADLERFMKEKEKYVTDCSKAHEEIRRLKDECSSTSKELEETKLNAETFFTKLKEQKYRISQELESAVTTQSELRYELQEKDRALSTLNRENKNLCEKNFDLLSQLESANEFVAIFRSQLEDMELKHQKELDDWHAYEQDLLRSVQVADDIKTESETTVADFSKKNHDLLEENKKLTSEIALLKKELEGIRPLQKPAISAKELACHVDKELAHVRALRRINNTDLEASHTTQVKSLIYSIEETMKHQRFTPSSPPTTVEMSSVFKSPMTGRVSPSYSPDKLARCTSTPSEGNLKPAIKKEKLNQLRDSFVSGSIHDEGSANSSSSDTLNPMISNILSTSRPRRNSLAERRDPLVELAKLHGGSKRNGLLKWCQGKVSSYRYTDITNFSSSWNDGMALCALLHSYLPDRIPYESLKPSDKRRNFELAFKAAESVGISSTLNINDMVSVERPDWNSVMNYITLIFTHFEGQDSKT